MGLAILSDVHGNLYALEAVLADMARQGAEWAVCLGDVANFGPRPKEALQRGMPHAAWWLEGWLR